MIEKVKISNSWNITLRNGTQINVDATLQPATVAALTDAQVQEFIDFTKSKKCDVIAHDTRAKGLWHPRGRISGDHVSHRDSTVPLAIGAAVSISQFPNHDEALTKLLLAQPQNAGAFFARSRDKKEVSAYHQATEGRAAKLMSEWARKFSSAATVDGTVREACLNGGTEVFAAFLGGLDFGKNIKDTQVESTEDLFSAIARDHHDATPFVRAERREQNGPLTFDEHQLQLALAPHLGFGAPTPTELAEKAAAGQAVRGAARNRAQAEVQVLPALVPLKNLILDLMSQGETCCVYTSAIVGMVAAGTALYSREKAASDKKHEDRTTLALGLTGAVVGFFPAAAPAAGLSVFLGTALVKHVSGEHSKRHFSVETAARRFGNAVIFDRKVGCAEAGTIILAALNGIQGRGNA